jgi:hypothetical protein
MPFRRREAILAAALASVALTACDGVAGSARTGAGRQTVTFVFDAHSGTSGETPTGTVSMDTFFGDLGRLPVQCLSVAGNRAEVVVRIDTPSPNAPAGASILVQDGGAAGPDRLAWTWLATLPDGCAAPAEVADPIVAGDVEVVDAVPGGGS